MSKHCRYFCLHGSVNTELGESAVQVKRCLPEWHIALFDIVPHDSFDIDIANTTSLLVTQSLQIALVTSASDMLTL